MKILKIAMLITLFSLPVFAQNRMEDVANKLSAIMNKFTFITERPLDLVTCGPAQEYPDRNTGIVPDGNCPGTPLSYYPKYHLATREDIIQLRQGLVAMNEAFALLESHFKTFAQSEGPIVSQSVAESLKNDPQFIQAIANAVKQGEQK